eukprot:GHVN01067080.1.p1 GENE.GHVN01067080.1~~GHVN01067080.1.p1  ORF type:complete len:1210 (+),score=253.28 GHVN01067080.1:143-3772(+)
MGSEDEQRQGETTDATRRVAPKALQPSSKPTSPTSSESEVNTSNAVTPISALYAPLEVETSDRAKAHAPEPSLAGPSPGEAFKEAFRPDWTVPANRVNNGRALVEDIQKVLRERAHLEETYAAGLEALALKLHSPITEARTSNDVVDALKLEMNHRAKHGRELCSAIRAEVLDGTLNKALLNHFVVFKQIAMDGHTVTKQLGEAKTALAQSLRDYGRLGAAAREATCVVQQCVIEDGQPAKRTQLSLNALHACRHAQDAEDHYKATLAKVQECERHHRKHVGAILVSLHDMDIKRISCQRDALMKFSIFQSAYLRSVQYEQDALIQAVERMNPASEVAEFVANQRLTPTPDPGASEPATWDDVGVDAKPLHWSSIDSFVLSNATDDAHSASDTRFSPLLLASHPHNPLQASHTNTLASAAAAAMRVSGWASATDKAIVPKDNPTTSASGAGAAGGGGGTGMFGGKGVGMLLAAVGRFSGAGAHQATEDDRQQDKASPEGESVENGTDGGDTKVGEEGWNDIGGGEVETVGLGEGEGDGVLGEGEVVEVCRGEEDGAFRRAGGEEREPKSVRGDEVVSEVPVSGSFEELKKHGDVTSEGDRGQRSVTSNDSSFSGVSDFSGLPSPQPSRWSKQSATSAAFNLLRGAHPIDLVMEKAKRLHGTWTSGAPGAGGNRGDDLIVVDDEQEGGNVKNSESAAIDMIDGEMVASHPPHSDHQEVHELKCFGEQLDSALSPLWPSKTVTDDGGSSSSSGVQHPSPAEQANVVDSNDVRDILAWLQDKLASSLYRSIFCKKLLNKMSSDGPLLLNIDSLAVISAMCMILLNWSHKQFDVWSTRCVMVLSKQIHAVGRRRDDPCKNYWDISIRIPLHSRTDEPPSPDEEKVKWYLERAVYRHPIWSRIKLWEQALLLCVSEDFQKQSMVREWQGANVSAAEKESQMTEFKRMYPCAGLLLWFGECMHSFGIHESDVSALIEKVCSNHQLGKAYKMRLLECLDGLRPITPQLRQAQAPKLPPVRPKGLNTSFVPVPKQQPHPVHPFAQRGLHLIHSRDPLGQCRPPLVPSHSPLTSCGPSLSRSPVHPSPGANSAVQALPRAPRPPSGVEQMQSTHTSWSASGTVSAGEPRGLQGEGCIPAPPDRHMEKGLTSAAVPSMTSDEQPANGRESGDNSLDWEVTKRPGEDDQSSETSSKVNESGNDTPDGPSVTVPSHDVFAD